MSLSSGAFAMEPLTKGYNKPTSSPSSIDADDPAKPGCEGKCGEGMCGEGKCGEGKCGQGKCPTVEKADDSVPDDAPIKKEGAPASPEQQKTETVQN
ncbi:hypothetical protein [Pseudoxanthomonas sp. Root65]|uniref:hypothetical protein n=1 Tax=Pseudoxanthomonas sp. Root65 TaxID=1736576 RepID=UPI0012E3978A|nr:hypothetical protein [Pseudoxanthomonas sp. Root65]